MKKKKNNFINHPVYPGGLKALRAFVKENLVYPKEALDAKVSGKVLVKYVVNEQGKVIQAKAIHGIGSGCDEEAERLVKLFKFDVKKTRGLKLKHNKSIKIHFNLAQTVNQKIKQSAKPISKLAYTTTKKEKPKEKNSDKGSSYGYEIRW